MQRDHVKLHRSLAVLGPPRRFQLMLLLLSGVDRSVSQLARLVRLSQSCTTRHLQSLERAGLVKGLRDGKRVVFRPAPRDATASGVLASLLRNADELAHTFDDETPRPAAPHSRGPRATRTIAVDAPLPAGEVLVAGRLRAAATPQPGATANVMLAAGRSRRSRAARREESRASTRASTPGELPKPRVRVVEREPAPPQPAPRPPQPAREEQAPARAGSPEPARRATPEKLASRIEPEAFAPRARTFDDAFEPEFEQPFQPPPPRVEPESGNKSDPHESPAQPSAGARRSSDIEDFLL